MMWNNWNCFEGGHPMMMFGGGIFMLVFWGLLIWLIFYAIRKWQPREQSTHFDRAIEELRQRYSRGEIDTEEYRQKLNELNKV